VAKTHQRVFALILAVLFLATSVAAGLGVIWQIRKDNQQTKAAGDNNNTQTAQEGTLEGTKLANFTAVEKVNALQITDTKPGDGEEVKAGATVTAHYTGALAKDGTIFQSSHDTGQPIEFSLSGVIAGWTEGVPGMKVGGTRRLTIPADKAYGANSPSPNIPANSDLVFDIEITAVKNQ